MRTVIDREYHGNFDRHQRWDRTRRADLFDQYRDLHAQGVSQRQAAKRLDVPRTTLQAWRTWHETLDACPQVTAFFDSGPGRAYLHRLVMALHIRVCRDQRVWHSPGLSLFTDDPARSVCGRLFWDPAARQPSR